MEEDRQKVIRQCMPVDWQIAIKALAEKNDLMGLPQGIKQIYYKDEF